MPNSRWLPVLLVVAVAGLAAGALSSRGEPTRLPAPSVAPVQDCTEATMTALPYRVRQPNPPSQLLEMYSCEIVQQGQFPAVRTGYRAKDHGWVMVEHQPKGSQIFSSPGAAEEDVPIGQHTASATTRDVNGVTVMSLYWDDGDISLLVNGALSPLLTRDVLLQFLRSLKQS